MALSEFEAKRYEKLVAAFVERRRPPPHMRHQVDLGFSFRGQSSVEIFEIRPRWDDAAQTVHGFVAKARFEKKSGKWKVYGLPADLKWHSYAPQPKVNALEDFLPCSTMTPMPACLAECAPDMPFDTDARGRPRLRRSSCFVIAHLRR